MCNYLVFVVIPFPALRSTPKHNHKVKETFGSGAELLLRLRVEDTGSWCPLGNKFGAEGLDNLESLLQTAEDFGLQMKGNMSNNIRPVVGNLIVLTLLFFGLGTAVASPCPDASLLSAIH